MADDKKFTFTLTGVSLKDIIQALVMVGGFSFLGLQQVETPNPDPDDKPVTVKVYRHHNQQEAEFRKDIREALKKSNEKLEFLYRLELQQLQQKKKWGMATK